jgi:hypothetical protein
MELDFPTMTRAEPSNSFDWQPSQSRLFEDLEQDYYLA